MKTTDTTVDLWDYYYLVRIPYIQSKTIEELKNVGVPLSGNKDVDNDIKNQWITTYMPVSKMVDMYKEGVAIRVVKRDDLKAIYSAIESHLSNWRKQLEVGINIGTAPLTDLIAMDEFATIVYEQAKYLYTETEFQSNFVKSISKVTTVNPTNFFKISGMQENGVTRIHAFVDAKETGTASKTTREGYGEFFRNLILGRKW